MAVQNLKVSKYVERIIPFSPSKIFYGYTECVTGNGRFLMDVTEHNVRFP
jgi:hypothetical protein